MNNKAEEIIDKKIQAIAELEKEINLAIEEFEQEHSLTIHLKLKPNTVNRVELGGAISAYLLE